MIAKRAKRAKKTNIIKYIAHYKEICIISVACLLLYMSFFVTSARYQSSVEGSSVSAEIASLILEIKGDTIDKNIARGKNITHYFSIQNYNEEKTTEVAYDGYIFITDENENNIQNVKLYKYEKKASNNVITNENPNTYEEIERQTEGKYKDGYYVGEFYLQRESQELKLEITDIQQEQIKIKAVGVQKDLT